MPLYNATNKTPATLRASFSSWTRIHIQVRDASTIYLSNRRETLELPGPNGQQGGLSITSAMGIISLPWIGPLYDFGSNPNSLFDLEFFPEGVEIGR